MSSDIADPDVRPPKLPLWDTICLSYSAYFRHFLDVLRASWIWLLLVVLMAGAAGWIQWSAAVRFIAGTTRAVPEATLHPLPAMPGLALFGNVANLVMVVAGVSIAVAWHRCLILGEQPGLSGSNLMSRDFWRYVGAGLAICLIAFVPIAVVAAPTFLWLTPPAAGVAPRPPSLLFVMLFVILLALYLAALVIFLRLGLLLPARATGDVDLTFRRTWRQTRGNTWRLFWGLTACTVPPGILIQIAFLGVVGVPGPTSFASDAFVARMTIFSTSMAAYYLLILPIWIGFISHAYLHFFRRVLPGAPIASPHSEVDWLEAHRNGPDGSGAQPSV